MSASPIHPPQPHGEALTAETPLFAADARYARLRGGPLTQAFIDALPTMWPRDEVVVDSTLVWLSRGLVPNGWRYFHREAYPDETRGAYGLANGELDTESISAAYGPSYVLRVRGEVDPETLPNAVPTSGRTDLRARHAAIVALIDAGRLSVESLPPGVPFAHTGRTFLRFTPAEVSGFHFWIRATRGSARPIVNGHRNVSNL